MTMRKISRLVTIPAIVGASLVSGFAVAAFVLSASVEASGKVATVTAPTARAHITEALWPGDCEDISVTFHNGNDRAIVVGRIDGSIAGQPGNGRGNLVRYQGTPHDLAGKTVPANSSATFVFLDAVCLSPSATNTVAGEDVTALVRFSFEVPVGSEYEG